jgi:hypothetical protein
MYNIASVIKRNAFGVINFQQQGMKVLHNKYTLYSKPRATPHTYSTSGFVCLLPSRKITMEWWILKPSAL